MRIPVLTYHAVLPIEPSRRVRGTVPLAVFEQQVDWLCASGFEAITLDRAADLLEGRGNGVARPVVLTFDDGYRCVFEHALPVLERAGLTATLFVVTEVVGKTTDWYRPKGGQPFEHMSWDEVERAQAGGFAIGAHGVNHLRASALEPEPLRDEVLGGKRELEKRLGRCDHFAYPFGDVTSEALRAVKEAGFRTACTTRSGRNKPGQPLAALLRQGVSRTTTARRFRRRLGHWW